MRSSHLELKMWGSRSEAGRTQVSHFEVEMELPVLAKYASERVSRI